MTEPMRYKTPGPVASRFMLSDARRRVIKGPFGSGKSVACVHEVLRRASQQKHSADGLRHTRFAVVRNTMPQLRDTTMKTWFQWFPNGSIGYYKETGKTYYIQVGDIRCEVMFRALDDEKDISNLLSLELTGAWFNEVREIPIAIVNAMDGRITRYPSKAEGGQTWRGMWADTNPPVLNSDWYYIMEGLDPETGEPPLDGDNGWEAFHQPSGLDDAAENIDNLNDGRAYYSDLMKGKTEDYINQYIHGEYGRSRAGRPVHGLFRRDIHVSKRPLTPNPRLPLLVSADFGLTPAFVFKQQDAFGRVLTLDEIVTRSMGLKRALKEKVVPLLGRKYRDFRIHVTGDPAGGRRSDADENTCYKVFRAEGFRSVQFAETNDPVARFGATDYFLGMLTESGAAYAIDPSCRYLIRGLEGGYHFPKKRKNGPDDEVSDNPEKNIFSHVCEANHYGDMYYEGGRAAKALARSRSGGLRSASPRAGAYTRRS